MQLKNTIDTNKFPQSIGLEEIVNARELGGYVGADGRKVKRGVLFRKYRKLTDAGFWNSII